MSSFYILYFLLNFLSWLPSLWSVVGWWREEAFNGEFNYLFFWIIISRSAPHICLPSNDVSTSHQFHSSSLSHSAWCCVLLSWTITFFLFSLLCVSLTISFSFLLYLQTTKQQTEKKMINHWRFQMLFVICKYCKLDVSRAWDWYPT